MALSGNKPRGVTHGQLPIPIYDVAAANIHWYEGEVVGQDLNTGIVRVLVPGLRALGVCVAEIDLSGEDDGAEQIQVRAGADRYPQDGTFAADSPVGIDVFWDEANNTCTNSDLAGTAAYLGSLIVRRDANSIEVAIMPEAVAQGGRIPPMAATIGHADLTATAHSQVITLGKLPPKARYVGCSIGETFTAFSGGGSGSLVVDIGGTDDDGIISNLDVFTGATGFPKNEGASPGAQADPYVHQFGGQTITATFTADVNVALLSAGSLSIRLFFEPLP